MADPFVSNASHWARDSLDLNRKKTLLLKAPYSDFLTHVPNTWFGGFREGLKTQVVEFTVWGVGQLVSRLGPRL